MPIETICPGCNRKLRVGDEFAGKQARCPVCNEIYTVSGVASNPAEQPPEDKTWRLKTPEGQIYGPVSKQELDQWVTDGRVTADCYVAPDESTWNRAEAVYPVLKPTPVAVRTSPLAGSAAAGFGGAAGNPRGQAAAGGGQTRYRYTAAHRGGLILALGVVSWVVGCPVFGLFAWTMGSADLREMRLGRMDPSGMGLTQAGQIIGMIHAILCLVALVIGVFIMLLAVGVS